MLGIKSVEEFSIHRSLVIPAPSRKRCKKLTLLAKHHHQCRQFYEAFVIEHRQICDHTDQDNQPQTPTVPETPAFGGQFYSTVTDFARFRGWSTSVPRSTAT